MTIIIDHTHPEYIKKLSSLGSGRYNGAYYYSKEIVENIIPKIHTDRNWITVNAPKELVDHSIVFIHNNLRPDHYDWLAPCKDLILVCGVMSTCSKVSHLGTAIYLPLSVDVDYVKQFESEKTKHIACVGRKAKFKKYNFPVNVDFIGGCPRDKLLEQLAQYQYVYAVGRCAIEARILGCTVLPYDERFPNPDIWKIVDNSTAANILQLKLNEIDK